MAASKANPPINPSAIENRFKRGGRSETRVLFFKGRIGSRVARSETKVSSTCVADLASRLAFRPDRSAITL